MADPGTKYGDPRLNLRVRNSVGEIMLYTVSEEDGTLNIHCAICKTMIFGSRNLTVHANGKKHAEALQDGNWSFVYGKEAVKGEAEDSDNNGGDTKDAEDKDDTMSPEQNILMSKLGLDKSKVGFVENSVTQRRISAVKKDSPLIGLEYVVEIQDVGTKANPATHCFLCAKRLNYAEVQTHLASASHRIRYLQSFFPTVHRKFAKVPNLKYWRGPVYDFLESVAVRIEVKFGRQPILTVQGSEYLQEKVEELKVLVESRNHCKEDDTLNFKTIPDPFGSFIKEIPPSEQVHIPEPAGDTPPQGIQLLDKYRNLLKDLIPAESGAQDSLENKSKSAGLDKMSVLHKITHLRQALNNDAEGIKKMLQYKAEYILKTEEEEPPTDMAQFKLRKTALVRGGKKRSRLQERAERNMARIFGSSPPGKKSPPKQRSPARLKSPTKKRSPQRLKSPPPRIKSESPGQRRRNCNSRSISPYVVARQNWDKFKKMEGAMLAKAGSRRDLYQKRPEDHPNYAEEWKLFWKRRYNELVTQGRDPSTHDFKADWIPHWENKLVEFFDIEILEKTDELLKKFDLTSVAEPKREHYERAKSPPRRQRSPTLRRHRSPSLRRHRSPSPRRRSPPRNFSPSPSPLKRRRYRSRSDSRERHHRSRSHERSQRVRNPSPPGHRRELVDRGRTGPSRLESQRSDLYSELEDRRDRGRSRSREFSHERGSIRRGNEFHLSDSGGGEVDISSVLRVLTALEDSLGSLGPHVNQILARSLSLEESRPGASKVMLEDPDSISILDMVKEKLQGQMMAGLLSGPKEQAVRVSLDSLSRLLQTATKKRSLNPIKQLSSETKDLFPTTQSVNTFIAKCVSLVLVQTERFDITDQGLEELMRQLMQETVEMETDPAILKVAKNFNEAVELEKRMKEHEAKKPVNPASNYMPRKPGPPFEQSHRSALLYEDDSNVRRQDMVGSGPAYVTPLYTGAAAAVDVDNEQADEADDFTSEELKSLVDNFDSLTRQEQEDLIHYMKKLEKTNPAKVRGLWPLLKGIQKTASQLRCSPNPGPSRAPPPAGPRSSHNAEDRQQIRQVNLDHSSDSDIDIICEEVNKEDSKEKSKTTKSKGKKKDPKDLVKFKLNSVEKESKTIGPSAFADMSSDENEEDGEEEEEMEKEKKEEEKKEEEKSQRDLSKVAGRNTGLTGEYGSEDIFSGRGSALGRDQSAGMNPVNPGLRGEFDGPRLTGRPGTGSSISGGFGNDMDGQHSQYRSRGPGMDMMGVGAGSGQGLMGMRGPGTMMNNSIRTDYEPSRMGLMNPGNPMNFPNRASEMNPTGPWDTTTRIPLEQQIYDDKLRKGLEMNAMLSNQLPSSNFGNFNMAGNAGGNYIMPGRGMGNTGMGGSGPLSNYMNPKDNGSMGMERSWGMGEP